MHHQRNPENVDVFVGSDSTNSVTAPCMEWVEQVAKLLVTEGDTHTHTMPNPARVEKVAAVLCFFSKIALAACLFRTYSWTSSSAAAAAACGGYV